MKNLIAAIGFFLLFSCNEKKATTYQNGKSDSPCKVCFLIKDWEPLEEGSHKNITGFMIGDNKFILNNDGVGHSKGFRYDNDSLIGYGKNFQNEMFNSQKGLYFFGNDETKTIKYLTCMGLGFSVNYNSTKNVVEKIEISDKEILLNGFENNKLLVVTHNESGSTDTLVYLPH